MRAKELSALVTHAAMAAPEIEPRCMHARPGQCGGCSFQDRPYAAQLAAKASALQTLWRDELPAELLASIEVVASPDPFAYRTRMDYVATKGYFGLRRRGKFNYVINLQECHLLPPAGFAAAQAVYRRSQELELPDYNLRSNSGFLRYVFVRRNSDDQFLLGLVSASREYAAEIEQLAQTALAQPGVLSFHWLLNETLTDLSAGPSLAHWGLPALPMRVGQHTLPIGPNTFFQNNIHLLEGLLQATAAAVGQAEHLADLYGGVGTIALALAGQARRIVSVEAVGESASLAQQILANAGPAHIEAVQADVGAYLRQSAAGSFDVVVADPPRIGLGLEVCNELLRLAPERIVYISCNPLTQLSDVQALAAGYRISSLRGYDMFPHTPHIETLALLERRNV